MKLLQVKPSALIAANYNPEIRTWKKELNALLLSIKEHGILNPILVDSEMNVIDGHRRLACARLLKLATIPIVVSDTKLTKDECYETINTTARKMSANEMIYVYVKGGRVPAKIEKRIKHLENILGSSELKKLGNKYISISVLSQGTKVSNFCNDKSPKFMKDAILWIVKHKQSYKVRKAMEDGVAKVSLKKAIVNDRPLKYEWK